MIIHQVLPTMAYGDAISNEVRMMQKLLRQAGHESEVIALNIDQRVKEHVLRVERHAALLEQADILIYHFSIGSPVLDQVVNLKRPTLIMRYHNITPGKYFALFAPTFKTEVDIGRLQLKKSLPHFQYILADSAFNRQDLVDMGYPAERITVLPVLIDFAQYDAPDDPAVRARMLDGRTNILFVGRVAPNKCHEDLIKAAYYYAKYYQPECRLILAGSSSFPLYAETLANLVRELGLGDTVLFTGHIQFSELLAYYRTAHVFLSMSEHEGFCVPVLESMHFNVPVIAYRSTALPETVGSDGLLLDDKDFRVAAGCIHRVMTDTSLRSQIIARQQAHLGKFKDEAVCQDFVRYIATLKRLETAASR